MRRNTIIQREGESLPAIETLLKVEQQLETAIIPRKGKSHKFVTSHQETLKTLGNQWKLERQMRQQSYREKAEHTSHKSLLA